MIKPAYSVSFLLSINIVVWQNVLYFPNEIRILSGIVCSCCGALVYGIVLTAAFIPQFKKIKITKQSFGNVVLIKRNLFGFI